MPWRELLDLLFVGASVIAVPAADTRKELFAPAVFEALTPTWLVAGAARDTRCAVPCRALYIFASIRSYLFCTQHETMQIN